MAEFKFVISEPETRKSYQKSVDQTQAAGVIGKKIGEEISGDFLGLAGYTLKITGGTDKDGFPMHPSVRGSVKKKILLSSPPGFYPKLKGQRKRKMVRGDTISPEIMQINVKVVKKGEKSLGELLPQKPKEEIKKAEEKKVEQKTEEKKEEKPAAKEEVEKKAEEKKESGGEQVQQSEGSKS